MATGQVTSVSGAGRARLYGHVNPRPVGGPKHSPPHTLNPKIYPKLKQIATPNILCKKIQVPGHNGSVMSDVRVTSCSADIDQKIGVYGSRRHGRSFEATTL